MHLYDPSELNDEEYIEVLLIKLGFSPWTWALFQGSILISV